jgi:iron complex outermembrane receptor protein
MYKYRSLTESRLLLTAASLFLILISSGLRAQDVTSKASSSDIQSQKPDDVVKLEKFIITGSSIKRASDEGALPMDIFTSAEIESKGITGIEQLIQQLNVNGNAMDNMASNADVVSSGTSRGYNGVTAANLRYQGSNATLVLLNGRRVAQGGLNGGGVVNLNTIPFEAIKRVEVLKDGASSTYGTEAIGGVINFILRDDFQGLIVNSGFDVTQEGGGNIYRYSALGGYGNLNKDKFNIMASLSVSKSMLLLGTQRSWINTQQPERGISPDTRGTPFATLNGITSITNVLSGASKSSFVDPSTGLSVSTVNTLVLKGPSALAGTGMFPYDWQLWSNASAQYGATTDTGKVAAIQQPMKNSNLVTKGSYKLGENIFSIEGVFGRSVSNKFFSASQLTSSATATTTNPSGGVVANPFYNMAYPSTGADYAGVFSTLVQYFPQLAINNGAPMPFRWRFYPAGERQYATHTDSQRILLSAEGPIPFLKGWDYRTGISRSESTSYSSLTSGYYYSQGIANLINTGVLSPFNLTQTPAAMTALKAASASGVRLYSGTYRTDEVDYTASGPIVKLPAGQLMSAVGFDYRQDRYSMKGDTDPNLMTSAGLIANAPFDNINASNGALVRTVRAEFGELNVPIIHGVDFNPSVRSDQYSGFGRTTNPKYTLRIAPVDWFLVRGSYSTGFRVPTFAQEYYPSTVSPGTASIVDPATGTTLTSYNIWTGGKTTLEPETALMRSYGFVIQPNKHLTFSVDWWGIDRQNTIESMGVTTILANYKLFPQRLVRDAGGNLTAIDNTYLNAGESVTKGLEYGVRADTNLRSGKLFLNFDLSDLLQKKSRLVASAPFGGSEVGRFVHGTYGELGIKYKATTNVTYTRGKWSASLTDIYRSGYMDNREGNIFTGTFYPTNWTPKVGSYNLYNLMVSYKDFYIKDLTLHAGVKNLFNTHPPFSAYYDTNSGAGSDWDPRVGDPRDRSFVLSGEYKWF